MHLADGIATLRALREAGHRDARIRTSIRRGEIPRVRPGVVASPDCDPRVLAACRVGGRVAGVTAAELRGFWAPRARLVVEVPRGCRIPPNPHRVVRGPAGPHRYGVSSLPDIVVQVLRSEPEHVAVAVLDSMLRASPMTRFDLEVAAARLPRRLRSSVALVDERSQSGTESILRVLLVRAGIPVAPQARLPFSDLGRVDLLVGDSLVIECDSRAHHSTPDELDRDNERDLLLTALGFRVLRVRYRTLMADPHSVADTIRRISTARHRFDPARR